MKKYDAYILSENETIKIFGKFPNFQNGFICEPQLDWWNMLENYIGQPIISVRPSGRESWKELIVIAAKGFLKDEIRYLAYSNPQDLICVLQDIFAEADNDELEVLDWYEGTNTKAWKEALKRIHEIYDED